MSIGGRDDQIVAMAEALGHAQYSINLIYAWDLKRGLLNHTVAHLPWSLSMAVPEKLESH